VRTRTCCKSAQDDRICAPHGRDLFDAGITNQGDFTERLALALGTIRGLAPLPTIGSEPSAVERHCEFAPSELAELVRPEAETAGR
jgi:hypothetical protein